jgi:hypothetical protein
MPLWISSQKQEIVEVVEELPCVSSPQAFIPTSIYGQPVRSWLEWWIRLNEQVAKLKSIETESGLACSLGA